jgi:hypothetical protein
VGKGIQPKKHGFRVKNVRIDKRRCRVAEMYIQGKYQWQIAEELGIVQSAVSQDLKAIQAEWAEKRAAQIDAHKAKELARLDLVERELWEAWQRSKGGDMDVRLTEAQSKATGIVPRAPRRDLPPGSVEFLNAIARCIELRCKIVGAFAAQKVEHAGTPGAAPIPIATMGEAQAAEMYRAMLRPALRVIDVKSA